MSEPEFRFACIVNVERNVFQRFDFHLAQVVNLADVAQLDEGQTDLRLGGPASL